MCPQLLVNIFASAGVRSRSGSQLRTFGRAAELRSEGFALGSSEDAAFGKAHELSHANHSTGGDKEMMSAWDGLSFTNGSRRGS